ncbi:MAG: transcriptional repressor [Candidatus Woesearchaeota archaeon]
MPKSRQTLQKIRLESMLSSINGFFTAEEFHTQALKKVPHLGIATVYRFLSEKVKRRMLHSYICDKRAVYSNNSSSHCHYFCQICGKKMHVDIKNIDCIKKEIRGTICHFQIDVTGICDNCLRKVSSSGMEISCKH